MARTVTAKNSKPPSSPNLFFYLATWTIPVFVWSFLFLSIPFFVFVLQIYYNLLSHLIFSSPCSVTCPSSLYVFFFFLSVLQFCFFVMSNGTYGRTSFVRFLFDSYLIMDILFKFYIGVWLVIFYELKEKNFTLQHAVWTEQRNSCKDKCTKGSS